jgi:hypothetical protein
MLPSVFTTFITPVPGTIKQILLPCLARRRFLDSR